METVEGGYVAFKGRNGMYMSASANCLKQEPHRQGWELFSHEITPDGMSCFVTAHSTYLSVSPGCPYGMLCQVQAPALVKQTYLLPACVRLILKVLYILLAGEPI